jgi:hypothetical protein
MNNTFSLDFDIEIKKQSEIVSITKPSEECVNEESIRFNNDLTINYAEPNKKTINLNFASKIDPNFYIIEDRSKLFTGDTVVAASRGNNSFILTAPSLVLNQEQLDEAKIEDAIEKIYTAIINGNTLGTISNNKITRSRFLWANYIAKGAYVSGPVIGLGTSVAVYPMKINWVQYIDIEIIGTEKINVGDPDKPQKTNKYKLLKRIPIAKTSKYQVMRPRIPRDNGLTGAGQQDPLSAGAILVNAPITVKLTGGKSETKTNYGVGTLVYQENVRTENEILSADYENGPKIDLGGGGQKSAFKLIFPGLSFQINQEYIAGLEKVWRDWEIAQRRGRLATAALPKLPVSKSLKEEDLFIDEASQNLSFYSFFPQEDVLAADSVNKTAISEEIQKLIDGFLLHGPYRGYHDTIYSKEAIKQGEILPNSGPESLKASESFLTSGETEKELKDKNRVLKYNYLTKRCNYRTFSIDIDTDVSVTLSLPQITSVEVFNFSRDSFMVDKDPNYKINFIGSDIFDYVQDQKINEFLNIKFPSGEDGGLQTDTISQVKKVLCYSQNIKQQEMFLTNISNLIDLFPDRKNGLAIDYLNFIKDINKKTNETSIIDFDQLKKDVHINNRWEYIP